MNFRRDGKSEHAQRREWESWCSENASLIAATGLPAGVTRTHGDWKYLLLYGYWHEGRYEDRIGTFFDTSELSVEQDGALRSLIDRYEEWAKTLRSRTP